MAQDTTAKHLLLPAQLVADSFVKHYYLTLRTSPEQVHKFYKDDSILGRPGSKGTMSSVTTMKGISDAIMSSVYKGCEPTIEAVNTQKSIMGSVIVGVTGSFTGKDKVKKNFTQTFFLAPQAGGFYVHNDFLQLMEINNHSTTISVPEVVTNSPNAPLRPDPGSSGWVLVNEPSVWTNNMLFILLYKHCNEFWEPKICQVVSNLLEIMVFEYVIECICAALRNCLLHCIN